MGVDHGLQGKEGVKSREKREKRAKRAHKTIGKVGLLQGKKKELVFNETARTEWLTGFHKRKQQRRQYGLTMGLLKEKKEKLDLRKQKRMFLNAPNDKEFDHDEETLPITSTETCFNDDSTNAMFGGDVSVIVDTGIVDVLEEAAHPGEMDDNDGGDGNRRKPVTKSKTKTKTRFEIAEAKAKEKMRHRAGRAGGKNRLQRSAKTRLLHKALGSGALGANEYKGNKKHRRKG